MSIEELMHKISERLDFRGVVEFSILRKTFDEFFKDKVIIQKGLNRHPDADIYHTWLKWKECEIVRSNSSVQKILDIAPLHFVAYKDNETVRIKPSEPVYEYQYLRIECDSAYPTEDFLTEEEAKALGLKIRLENTKKPRQ